MLLKTVLIRLTSKYIASVEMVLQLIVYLTKYILSGLANDVAVFCYLLKLNTLEILLSDVAIQLLLLLF